MPATLNRELDAKKTAKRFELYRRRELLRRAAARAEMPRWERFLTLTFGDLFMRVVVRRKK